MNPAELLSKLPVMPVYELLASLAEAYERSDDPARPRLPEAVLHLRGGRDLSGRIVRLGQDSGRGRTLLVWVGGYAGVPDGALYVPLDSVEAVTVLEPERCADLLSGGTLPAPPSNVPAPSRFEILRAVKELTDGFAKERGVELKLDVETGSALPDEAMRSLSVLVRESFSALTEIASDALGKESLMRVRLLRIADGPSADVRLADGRLEIAAALARGRAGRLSQDELRSRIASLL